MVLLDIFYVARHVNYGKKDVEKFPIVKSGLGDKNENLRTFKMFLFFLATFGR